MLVAEKTRHINAYVYGQGAEFLVETLRKEIPSLEILPEEAVATDNDEAYSEVSESEWFKDMKRDWHPGKTLLIRRENKGWTQAELSARTGIAIPNVSLMEAGKRPIGARTAKKLADALGCDVSDFIA
ncbi:MAG: helix-turn-helix transcriptional regulator [Treponema sp.]|nr:helix-turn-helix transcriptional regulator [Treponema sp.]